MKAEQAIIHKLKEENILLKAQLSWLKAKMIGLYALVSGLSSTSFFDTNDLISLYESIEEYAIDTADMLLTVDDIDPQERPIERYKLASIAYVSYCFQVTSKVRVKQMRLRMK